MKFILFFFSIVMLTGCTLDTSCYDFWKGGDITLTSGTNGDAKCEKN